MLFSSELGIDILGTLQSLIPCRIVEHKILNRVNHTVDPPPRLEKGGVIASHMRLVMKIDAPLAYLSISMLTC